ncbi:MAG TPA: hypothetical protein VFA11_17260 [Acidimicrobiales bacterium]|nr:hypothetical protein [Acidimicrobiales bacterium]
MVIFAGLVIAAAGVVVAFIGSLCGLDESCSSADHATAGLGLAIIALGLVVPPLLAVWATRRWWWLAAPVVVVGAVVAAVTVGAAHNAARQRQAVESYTASRRLAATLDAVAGFGPVAPPPPTATVAERVMVARRTQQSELDELEADRARLAAQGISLGDQQGYGQVNVTQAGQKYCYRVPLFALRGSAEPGSCHQAP